MNPNFQTQASKAQLWFSGLGSLNGRGLLGFPLASGCGGLLCGGLGFFGFVAEHGTHCSTSAININLTRYAGVLANHHPKPVSTPPQDFAARRLWAQEPLSCIHPRRGHPLGAGLFIQGLLTKVTQSLKPLRPICVVRSVALAKMLGIVA
jgi:hypothetical protein